MNIKLVVSTIAALVICNASLAAHHEAGESSSNELVAVNWLKAQATGKDATITYVKNNFADGANSSSNFHGAASEPRLIFFHDPAIIICKAS